MPKRLKKMGKPPDYNLVLSPKPDMEGEYPTIAKWTTMGAAWVTGAGTGLNLKLNAGVTITWQDLIDFNLLALPNETRDKKGEKAKKKKAEAEPTPKLGEDKIPF